MSGGGLVPSLDSTIRSRFIKGGHFVAMQSCEVFISCDRTSACHVVDIFLVGLLLIGWWSYFFIASL